MAKILFGCKYAEKPRTSVPLPHITVRGPSSPRSIFQCLRASLVHRFDGWLSISVSGTNVSIQKKNVWIASTSVVARTFPSKPVRGVELHTKLVPREVSRGGDTGVSRRRHLSSAPDGERVVFVVSRDRQRCGGFRVERFLPIATNRAFDATKSLCQSCPRPPRENNGRQAHGSNCAGLS